MPQNGVQLNGAEVRRRRENLFLTQEQLAAKISIHPNTLIKIESDPTYRTGLKTASALARRFKCLPADLRKDGGEREEGVA